MLSLLLLAPTGALKTAFGIYPTNPSDPIPHIALSVQYHSILIQKGYKDRHKDRYKDRHKYRHKDRHKDTKDTKTDKKTIKW